MIASIRCSRLPLALLCPASQQPGEYATTSDGDAARLGTACHEVMAYRIGGGVFDDFHVGVIAVKYGVDRDELAALSRKAFRLWEEVAKWFPAPHTEVALLADHGDFTLTGTADILSYDADRKTVFVADLKTGFLDSDHADQVKGYAYLSLRQFPEAEQAHTILLRVRDYVCDHGNYSREELEAWFSRVVERLSDEATAYNPGRHCAHCPKWSTCPAYRDHARGAYDVLTTFFRPGEIGQLSHAPAVAQIYNSIKTLEKLCSDARDALKSQAQQNGGAVQVDDDYELRLVGQVRQTIRFDQAFPILRKQLSWEEIASAVSVSKGKVQELVKAKAGKGEKGRAAAALMEELDGAGALDEQIIERLELKRKEQPQLTGATA